MLTTEQKRRIAPLWDAPWDVPFTKPESWEDEQWVRAIKANLAVIKDCSPDTGMLSPGTQDTDQLPTP
jgi:hypothetical protein